MCGIYGAVGCGIGEAQALAALRTLVHRGPDGEGHHHDAARDVFLGHRRLAIVDLSDAASQPMANEDGSLLLVLNGEIYNHAALRDELAARGHVFRSRCDAEVVLHLYEEMGMELLHRLQGMFAFALHDRTRGELHLARDRIGIKPMHYYAHDGRLVFASELKAIRATPGLDLAPDPTALYDFLTYQFVPAPKTVYRHVRKLPPGHRLCLREGRSEVVRWWDVDFTPDEDLSEERALGELEALLGEVVPAHLMADVPVGVFLSGGFDSSLVAAVAATATAAGRAGWTRGAGRPALHAFTIGSRGSRHDESEVAARTAQRLGLTSHVHPIATEEVLRDLALGADVFDEPFADHSYLPTLALSRLAARHVKAVLSGDGGDETHLGYGRYFKEERRRWANALGDALPFAATLVRSRALRGIRGLRTVGEGYLGRLCQQHGGIPRGAKRVLLDVRHPELRDYDDYWLYREHLRPALSDHARQQHLDLVTLLPDRILTKVDRASMRHGLEVRPPLLDHRLVEWAARLPDRLKLEGGGGKRLLRRLLARHGLSERDGLRERGFSIPMREPLEQAGLLGLARDVDVLDAFRIRSEGAAQLFRSRSDQQRLWQLHVLAAWLDTHAGP